MSRTADPDEVADMQPPDDRAVVRVAADRSPMHAVWCVD